MKGNIKRPVLVPADAPVALHLTESSKRIIIGGPRALCIACALKLGDDLVHYRAMAASEALDYNDCCAYGMCCDSCGQVFTLSTEEATRLGWKLDMHGMDARLLADSVLAIIDGEGAREDSYYDEPLVKAARELARLVLESK